MKMPISKSNALRRSIRAVAIARKGDPNATLNAYPVTRRPAWGIVTPRSPATSGNSPMITNSVVPIPNEANARASKGSGLVEAGISVARGMSVYRFNGTNAGTGTLHFSKTTARWPDEASRLYAVCFQKHYHQS